MKKLSTSFVTGVAVFAMGVLLRCAARALAWPSRWTYQGERINTEWANREAIYIDLSYFAVALGIALIAVSLRNARSSE